MSSIVNKVKDALHSKDESKATTHNDPTHTVRPGEPRTGPGVHDTGADTTLGHGKGSYTTSDNYALGGDNRGVDGPATRTDGPHQSNVMNKVDPRIDSDRDHSKNMGANPHGTATTGGVHSSDTSSRADPHVDSSRIGGRNEGVLPPSTSTASGHHPVHSTQGHQTRDLAAGATAGSSVGIGTAGAGHHDGTHGITEANRGFDGPATKTDGPRSSNLLNKMDPRVDSDRDHSTNLGANPHGTATTGNTAHGTTGITGGSGLPGAATHGTAGTTGTSGISGSGHTQGAPEGTYGHHSSRAANAADPRIDSDRDGSRNIGAAQSGTHTGTHTRTHTGAHMTGTHAGTTGVHGTGSHTDPIGGTTGPAPNTAGPHKSDMLNKADPRVDSDLDGSKTIGGNKTFDQSCENEAKSYRDPTDAAQVPPSVLQKHIGDVTLHHNDAHHDRQRRHSVSHQENYRGL